MSKLLFDNEPTKGDRVMIQLSNGINGRHPKIVFGEVWGNPRSSKVAVVAKDQFGIDMLASVPKEKVTVVFSSKGDNS